MSERELFASIVADQKSGRPRGIASVCSAHPVVIRAAIRQAEADGLPLLVESTSNQVNQFGGYTGMQPADFRRFVLAEADRCRFPADRVIFGGDHLGPYPWRSEPAPTAMEKACDLVAACVRAGYRKIHLDASMPLGGDPLDEHGAVPPELVAEREAELAEAAEAAAAAAAGDAPARHRDSAPMYVIGTEVPPPGGIVAEEEAVPVTRTEDLLETVDLCRSAFAARGLEGAWERVFAVVAQPGVEFGDETVHPYDRSVAHRLCDAARGLPGIVLEGHSTDYQTAERLRWMVEDGVAVLKVGPALTFAIRECLVGLEHVERELVSCGLLRSPAAGRLSDMSAVLERAMTERPEHWKSYYEGTPERQRFSRVYSLSDRIRYYWAFPDVQNAVNALVTNLDAAPLPITLASQFVGGPYRSLWERGEPVSAAALLVESVRIVLRTYSHAVGRGGA